MAVDALGNPVRLVLTAGQKSDIGQAPQLIAGIRAENVVADKGYDSDDFVETIEATGAVAVIPPRRGRKTPRTYDRTLYKERNIVERFLNRIKNCRRVATRYDKTARNFQAFVTVACLMVLLA